jgi:hypothetical protein
MGFGRRPTFYLIPGEGSYECTGSRGPAVLAPVYGPEATSPRPHQVH